MRSQYLYIIPAVSIAAVTQSSYANSSIKDGVLKSLNSLEVGVGNFLISLTTPAASTPKPPVANPGNAKSELVPTFANFPTSPDRLMDEPEMGGFVVSSPAELTRALTEAKAGSIIRLTPGNYGNYRFTKAQFANGLVSIVSEQFDNPAVFSSINLSGASGILLGGLKVAGDARPLINVSSASNIVLSGLHFTGVTADRDPWDEAATAIWVRNSSGITIYSNRFEDVRIAIFLQRSQGVSIIRNELAYVREGINVAATDKLRIEGNHFHSFSPRYQDGEHPDAVQFWTSNETVGSTNVSLKNNYFQFGGRRAVQGIFARSEVAESGKIPTARHADWVVTGNIYYGSSRHGISLNSIDRARVENNIVAASPWADLGGAPPSDDAGRSSGGYQPWIKVGKASGSTVRNNGAMLFSTDEQVDFSNNIDLYDPKLKKGAEWTVILKARPTSDRPNASEFVTYEFSPAAHSGVGVLRLSSFGLSASLPARLTAEAAAVHQARGHG